MATLATEVAISRARAAARAGDLDAAERLLTAPDPDGPSPARLDLLARVYAQQGRHAEADACWAAVLDAEPGHRGAVRGRALIAGIGAGRHRARPLLTPGRVTAAATAVLLAGGLAWGVATTAGPAPVAGAPAAAPAVGPDTAPAGPSPATLDGLAAALAVPGATATRVDGAVLVTFTDGLFARSDRLTAAGADALARVADRLAGLPGQVPVQVTVVGHAVAAPGGPTAGGSGVALGRALTAARQIAARAGLPLTAFTLRSADQADGPWTEPGRNRTVTLLVRPAG